MLNATPEIPTIPVQPEGAVRPYLRAIRAHRLLVAAVTLAAIVASLAWLTLRSPDYEATAQLLVTPVPADDETLVGLHLIRESSGDPTRTIETAATLVESVEAASRTARTLGPDWTFRRVLDEVEVTPQGQSNIVAVTAKADTATGAAQIANEFVRSALAVRREALQKQAGDLQLRLRARRRAVPSDSPEATSLAARVEQLGALRRGEDPTLSLSQQARPPDKPTGLPVPLVLVLSAIAGLSLGSGAALLREVLERRVRDELEVVTLYPLPVLARVPVLKRRQFPSKAQVGWVMPPPIHEAFRTLLAQLGQHGGGRVVMVASASTGDGKTTSAINLATAIAATGDRAVLLDLDLRKPDVGRILGMQKTTSVPSLLADDLQLADLLVSPPALPSLSVLATAAAGGDPGVIETVHRRLPQLIEQARKLADWVVLDTAPLGEVSDALWVTPNVDDLVIVTRPGHTNRASLEVMRGLLERTPDAHPTGLVVIARPDTRTASLYYASSGVGPAIPVDRGVDGSGAPTSVERPVEGTSKAANSSNAAGGKTRPAKAAGRANR